MALIICRASPQKIGLTKNIVLGSTFHQGEVSSSSFGQIPNTCKSFHTTEANKTSVKIFDPIRPTVNPQNINFIGVARKRNVVSVTQPEGLKHFRKVSKSEDITENKEVNKDKDQTEDYLLPHPIWNENEMADIQITHREPVGIVDKLAYKSVRLLRNSFDMLSGYNRKIRDDTVWINRICFLETVAGVPGMVAAMTRHLHSLRRLQRDHGWIHTLLEEAENERMHLMTALQIKEPGPLFRLGVMVTQGMFVSAFSLAYLISPRFCHRFVGYLEEEAVITYTKCLKEIEEGNIQHWKTQKAPELAINYWKLAPDATMLTVIKAIRADEAHHRIVNHTLASMKVDAINPYKPGE